MNNSTSPWNRYFWGTLAAFGLLFLAVAETRAAPIKDLPKMQEQMFEPSVQLGKFCSGTLIYSDRDDETGKVNTIVLTAKHCVEKVDERLQIMFQNYNKSNRQVSETGYDAKVIGISYKSDLALIKLNDQDKLFTVAKVAPKETGESLLFGQDVYSVSYPMGGSKTFTVGSLGRVEVIPPFETISNTAEYYRATPDIFAGSSGSAMFQNTTGDYELIGVLTGGYGRVTFMNLYTPIEEIHDYLDVAKKSYEVKKKVKDDAAK